MKNLILLVLLPILAVLGCGRSDNPVDSSDPVIETPEEIIVIDNCRLVQAAVEEFAARNGGIYPVDVDTDTTSSGSTVLDLLLGGRPLENPFTECQTEPVNGRAANPGETGYLPVSRDDWNVGYVITGFGKDSVIVELTNIESPEEAAVRANCLIVLAAAEGFAGRSDGTYPGDGDAIYTDIRRLLPDYRPLENPFTGLLTEPVMHTAVSRGETGYTAVRRDGVNIGCVVTGFGGDSIIMVRTNLGYSRVEALVASNCRTVQKAVEEFAVQNGGLYPEDVDSDRSLTGRTVLDLLPGGVRLENPFTGLATEPVGSAAVNPGETGYEAIRLYGWDIGYAITGFGEVCRIAELNNLEPPEEAVVRANCQTLRQAVEAFAVKNAGVYPEDVYTDTTPGGETVVDLLPRDRLIENPFDRSHPNLVNHTAVYPGEAGYAVFRSDGVNAGYVISGFGESSIIVVINNIGYLPGEALVAANCRTVQLAAEAFAVLNGGVYAGSLSDLTPCGQTIIDLLPLGRRLVNPFTEVASEPVDGFSSNPGETSYVVVIRGGVNAGYTIRGADRRGNVIVTIWKAIQSDQKF